ncbi:BEL1-like homeodomain protein 8 isoform X2 [Telopea speciosissima]|uniref:BEL1-like homeodomain protein 8 isoform X2 n=1 Tax=Telopea speciosissima TaxID=54955 RepID=UPI001CC5EE84|nr:BEL1-like homeodomain protein 8 isoform X2 [Telopea speciosissima]
MQFSSPFYQNTLQEVVTSSGIGRQGFEMGSRVREAGSWVNDGNELVLFPSYGNQNNGSSVNTSAEKSDSMPQGLSLSLSSHRPSELLTVQFGGRFGSEDFQSQANGSSSSQDSKTSGYLCSSSSSKSPLTCVRRSTAPLGPFTGYALILKCSKFLKPAQYLLDEFCNVTGPRFMGMCKTTEKGSRNIISTCDTANIEIEIGPSAGRSGISSSSFYGSNEASGECGSGSGPYQSCHPEFQQRKARLLYMQEEICRRYKQYHQQMHIVVSSFESVAGLSAATPYTTLALKAVSRHFRGLKNVISDQLQHINRAIGDDLSSPTTGTSSSKGETILPMLRFNDRVVHKQKSGGDSPGILQPQQHIWRPQRGLPERSVAILRAWLFEHFLHPYPTDTDKDMLASQTGLTRNQVSNWFINARVRVWKPMVEEIHMLETKGSAEANLTSSSNVGEPVATSGSTEPMGDHNLNKFTVDAVSEKGSECSGVVALPNREDDQSSEQCKQGKRLRMEHQFPADVCGGLMGFMPYNQHRLEIGGVGAVSLTLGLRHSAEGAQQLQHRQERQQEHQLISHFGAQMVHDFVG